MKSAAAKSPSSAPRVAAPVSVVDQTRRDVRLVGMLGISVAVSIVAAVFSLYLATSGKVAAIGVTDSGRVLPLVTLDKPFVTEPRLLGFVEDCIRSSFQHAFTTYRQSVSQATACFDSDGANLYIKAIDPLLVKMREDRRNMVVVIDRPPVVARGPYLIGGVAVWDIEAGITLHYEGTRDRIPGVKYDLSMLVRRVDLEENERGVAVRRFVIAPARGK